MEYEVVIGLEVHAELSTESKIYCGCTTEFGAQPNTQACPVCMGMPGTLPVLNKRVVEYAVKAGLATNCHIAQYSKQDRKNYFYPDLPKAFQTSQYDLPICYEGYIEVEIGAHTKRIGITRIHIEEDAGKLIHDDRNTHSLIDYNRCGVPLIEIVSEPDMRSAQEVRAYLEVLKGILEYIDVSDCKMQEGSFRADINLSVRPVGGAKLGTRTEMKNLNSFGAITRAIEREAQRQIQLIEAGQVVVQQTRRWDDVEGESYAMREKEEAHDYRYFPEPDLMPVIIDDEWKQNIKNTLPELAQSRKKRYVSELGLPEYDASMLTSSKALAEFFETASSKAGNAKAVSNWIMGDLLKLLKEKGLEVTQIPFPPQYLADVVIMIDKGKISGTMAKSVFDKMFEGKSPEQIVKDEGLEVVSDESVLKAVVEDVLKANPKSIDDYKNGKDKAFGFLVGQAMRATKGKASPQIINRLLKDALNTCCT